MKRHIGEIFALFEKAQTKKGKIRVLRENDEPYLRRFLVLAFDPRPKWIWAKPEAKPHKPQWSYSNSPDDLGESNLINEYRRIQNLTEQANLSERTYISLTVQILENLTNYEADIADSLISGKGLSVPGLTKDLVNEAFPGLLPNYVLQEEKPAPAKTTKKKKTTSSKTTTTKKVTKKRTARRKKVEDEQQQES